MADIQDVLILLADDDPTFRRLIVKRLQQEGYSVVEAADGAEAVQAFAETLPDVVMLDALMPTLSGFEACQRIKELSEGADTPILILTDLDDAASIDHAFEVGAADYFTKHLNFTILKNRLRQLVKHKRTQDALYRSRHLLNHVLTHSPVFLYTTDAKGVITFNQGGTPPDLGLPPQGQTGVSIFDCYQDKPLLANAITTALKGDNSTRVIAEKYENISLWHAPLYARTGEIIGVIGVGVAIQEAEWQNTALQEMQRTMQNLLSNVHGALYRSSRNPKWQLEYVSQGIRDLTGYTPGELIGNPELSLLDLIHPDDLPQIERMAYHAARTGDRFQMMYRMHASNGAEKWVLEQGIALPTKDGSIVLEGFITDITDLKHMEESLLTERGLLRTLIDNLPDFVFVKDTEGRFMISNMANTRYLGAKHPREVIGKTDYDFFPAERADLFRADDQAITSSRQPMLHNQLKVYYGDEGAYRWYDITKAPFTDTNNQVVGIVGMIRDVTQGKDAENQMVIANKRLTELNRMKSHFLLSMSHELRTPLNIIMGNTDMLLFGMMGDLNDTQRDRLERVKRNGQQLLSLIEDVLDLSKIQTGTMEMKLEKVDFSMLLEHSLPRYATDAEKKGLLIQRDLEIELPPIYADASALLKILNHLVSNAVKFTEQGYIYIGAQSIPPSIAQKMPITLADPDQAWILISVQDTGIGISKEIQQGIFDEFRQADNSTTRQHGGMGLGLAVCRHLVTLMQGHIWVESAIGYGSTFFVLLPTG